VRLLDRLLLKIFLPVFFISLAFFVLIIELMDLFGNLVRYLNLEVPLSAILQVQLLFLPRALTFALPIAVLFAAAYALGTLYSNNELIAVFGAGVPIWRFTAPLIVGGVVLSVALFFFQEYVVIDTFRQKNELSRQMLNISRSFSNTNVTVRSAGGRMIYSAEYYNDANRELSRILILERNERGQFVERIDAERARWSNQAGIWIIDNGTRYLLADPEAPVGQQEIISEPFTRLEDVRYAMPPERFRRSGQTIDELRFDEAREWVLGLRDAGQAYRQPLTSYYSRFSFPLTPFIVVLLASGLGGRFRKNVLLMSLFVSLVASVVYYVTGMVAELLAGDAVLPPLVGAWLGVVLFTAGGIAILKTART
jgi:lipopolysaccharide export system permease protein